MPAAEALRPLAALLLAVGSALFVDRVTERRGFLPPGFRRSVLRRSLFGTFLALVFFVGIFFPAVHFDRPPELDLESVEAWQLFLFQGVLALCLGVWYLLGYVGVRGVPLRWALGGWVRQLGLRARSPLREIGAGLVAGVGGWLLVLAAAVGLGLVMSAFGVEGTEGDEPPPVVVWLAALPAGWKLALSLVAGVVEELFFRGLLQPRVGILFSSSLFVLGHLSYGEPWMLGGLAVLSLYYAVLVRLRGNVWPAIAAHFLFDAVQLLVVIPLLLEALERGLLGA